MELDQANQECLAGGNPDACQRKQELATLSADRDAALKACAGNNSSGCAALRQDLRAATIELLTKSENGTLYEGADGLFYPTGVTLNTLNTINQATSFLGDESDGTLFNPATPMSDIERVLTFGTPQEIEDLTTARRIAATVEGGAALTPAGARTGGLPPKGNPPIVAEKRLKAGGKADVGVSVVRVFRTGEVFS